MEGLLQPVQGSADPFVDNIIIRSDIEDMTNDKLMEDHEKDLRQVIGVLDNHSMVCKPTRASLFVREVEFAGHVVGRGHRRPMPGKQPYATWKRPKPSVNSSPSWDFADIIRVMLECIRISRGLSNRCYSWASLMVARDGRKIGMENRRRRFVGKREGTTLRSVGSFLGRPGEGICAAHGRLGLCRGGSSRASPVQWNTFPSGLLESGPGGRTTSNVYRQGEGDLCHHVRALEIIGPHQTSTGGGMYRSSITSELAQGACGYLLGSSSKARLMAGDVCEG